MMRLEMVIQPLFIEIRHTNELTSIKTSLTGILIRARGRTSQVREINLQPYGIDRTIQILGNTYVPIRRSEQQKIQAALSKLSPQKEALTFLLIEDALFENVMTELQHCQEAILGAKPEVFQGELKREKHGLKRIPLSTHKATLPKKTAFSMGVWKKTALQQIKDLFTEEIKTLKKEKAKEKREQELLKEEKCIQHGIEQFEQLQQMVLKEATERRLSHQDLKQIFYKWEESSPPFPIRSTHFSTLWREYKTKMLEDLLTHF